MLTMILVYFYSIYHSRITRNNSELKPLGKNPRGLEKRRRSPPHWWGDYFIRRILCLICPSTLRVSSFRRETGHGAIFRPRHDDQPFWTFGKSRIPSVSCQKSGWQNGKNLASLFTVPYHILRMTMKAIEETFLNIPAYHVYFSCNSSRNFDSLSCVVWRTIGLHCDKKSQCQYHFRSAIHMSYGYTTILLEPIVL